MAFPDQQPDMLGLLHYQNRFYTSQLSQSHQSLGKLYKKLWRLEREVSESKEQNLTRKEKKRIKWTLVMTRATIRNIEAQQAHLHEYLRQCASLITSYDSSYLLPPTPWSAETPTFTYPWSPFDSIPPTPWTAGPFKERPVPQSDESPQFWDLSSIPHGRESSPSAADSGFHEPALYAQPFEFGEINDPNHVWAHEVMAPPRGSGSKKSSLSSERDDVPEMVSPTVELGAEASPTSAHKRRFSENAIQLIESRLGVKRTASEGPKADRVRDDKGKEVDALSSRVPSHVIEDEYHIAQY